MGSALRGGLPPRYGESIVTGKAESAGAKEEEKMAIAESNGFRACWMSGGSTKFSVQGKVPKVPK